MFQYSFQKHVAVDLKMSYSEEKKLFQRLLKKTGHSAHWMLLRSDVPRFQSTPQMKAWVDINN